MQLDHIQPKIIELIQMTYKDKYLILQAIHFY